MAQQRRHPRAAAHRLQSAGDTPHVESCSRRSSHLTSVQGFGPPSWEARARGARPPPREPDDFEPARQTSQWQHQASSRVERQFRDSVRYGRRAGTSARALSKRIKSALTRIDPQLSCVLLLRRLSTPLPLSKLSCQCGRPLDPSGHRRAANARAGLFDRPGYAGKRAATKISREGTPRATTSVMDREMDLHARTQYTADDWRLWQTAFSCSRGATWTHVSVLQCFSPELIGQRSQARLVVLAGEVGWRWSEEKCGPLASACTITESLARSTLLWNRTLPRVPKNFPHRWPFEAFFNKSTR